MLKTWLLHDGDLGAITVEERCLKQQVRNSEFSPGDVGSSIDLRFVKFVENSESDQYVTMSILQLEKEFGDGPDAQEFIGELIKGNLDSSQVSHRFYTEP